MARETDPEDVERELARDLRQLTDAVREDAFAGELYRGLANHRLSREDSSERTVSLSWRRAEELVNELREQAGEEHLTLAQTGGEGFLSDRVETALRECGWIAAPLDTSTHDPEHVAETDASPPKGHGEAGAPSEPPQAWREAHAEADRR